MNIEPGTYVVATSGGVDSMALLEMLRHKNDLKLIVAHFDHGIRPDSRDDRKLIQDVAKRHNLPFVYEEGKMGQNTSEADARNARYAFLHSVREASGALAVITAHHQNDLLETAIHNMLRGTGRKGLVSLRSRQQVRRPMLHIKKSDLITYAIGQGLVWREDSTNSDIRYRRNYIRHKILPKLSHEQKAELLNHIRSIHRLHDEIELEIINHLHLHPGKSELDRHWFIMLPHNVSKEILAEWLRRHGVQEMTSRTLERLIIAAKTFSPGKQTDVDKKYAMHIEKNILALRLRDR